MLQEIESQLERQYSEYEVVVTGARVTRSGWLIQFDCREGKAVRFERYALFCDDAAGGWVKRWDMIG